ncbi:MAG: class I SAM-dependent methyltransferase [Hyphomicrobiaceae bacterium]
MLRRDGGKIVGIGYIEEGDVKDAYRRWAPIYDQTFGFVAAQGRRHVVEVINRMSGSVLEVGVGTGLSLPGYAGHLQITGIDLSPDMLEKARERVTTERLDNVAGLYEMDAGDLEFNDGTFDVTVAMFVMTVVPDPEKVMRELSRVTRPGGRVLLVNHFSQDEGVRGWVERRMAPFADKIGWRSVFDLDRVMVCGDLRLVQRRSIRPFGLFTMLEFEKSEQMSLRPVAAE